MKEKLTAIMTISLALVCLGGIGCTDLPSITIVSPETNASHVLLEGIPVEVEVKETTFFAAHYGVNPDSFLATLQDPSDSSFEIDVTTSLAQDCVILEGQEGEEDSLNASCTWTGTLTSADLGILSAGEYDLHFAVKSQKLNGKEMTKSVLFRLESDLPAIRVNSPLISSSHIPYQGIPVEVVVTEAVFESTHFGVDPDSFTAVLNFPSASGLPEMDVTGDLSRDCTVLEGDDLNTSCTWTGTITEELIGLPLEQGTYRLSLSVDNIYGNGRSRDISFLVEKNVYEFPGGSYNMSISKLAEEPENCLIGKFTLGIIYLLIQNKTLPLYLPSADAILAWNNDYPLTISMPSPLQAANATIALDEENNDLALTGQGEYTIDTSMANLPGLYCIITGIINGGLDYQAPEALNGELTVQITDVQASGGGACNYTTPVNQCNMVIGINANAN